MLKKNKVNKQTKENPVENYFQLASSWSDDYYATMMSSRDRYRIAFFAAMGLSALLALSVMVLSNTHEYIPLLVHHYESGAVSVSQVGSHDAPENQAEVESELVRYVISRESYDPTFFAEQYELVSMMSDSSVSREYHEQQNADNPSSFIHEMGAKVVRSVKVEEVSFLDKEDWNETDKHDKNHKNLAEVRFIVTDKKVNSGQETKTPYVVMLSWTHRGIPTDPDARWQNWNGFTVTHYQRNQRSV